MNNDFLNQLSNNSYKSNKEFVKNKNYNENTISAILKIIAWIVIIIGFIIGIVYGSADSYEFDGLKMFATWLIFGGGALGCFALAEIIQLLQDIKDRLTTKNDNIVNKENEKQELTFTRCKECGNIIENGDTECSKCLTPVNYNDNE